MAQLREIHWPEGPEQGDLHSEGGRTWEYVTLPPGSSVHGVWRDVGCQDISTGPGWDLDSIKDWLEINVPDYDDQIIAAMKVTMAFVERYCNRLFEWRDNHQELKLPQKGNGWQLHLWPVSGSVYIDSVKNEYLVDNERGVIWFPNYQHKNFHQLQYSGGYKADEWPADLLQVLMNAIKNQWQISTGGETADKVSRITIPDVGTISYNAGTSWSTDIGLGTNFGPISQQDQIVLNLYRLWEC
jgi:hypothetical protein